MAISDTQRGSIHGKPYSGLQEVSGADGLDAFDIRITDKRLAG